MRAQRLFESHEKQFVMYVDELKMLCIWKMVLTLQATIQPLHRIFLHFRSVLVGDVHRL